MNRWWWAEGLELLITTSLKPVGNGLILSFGFNPVMLEFVFSTISRHSCCNAACFKSEVASLK